MPSSSKPKSKSKDDTWGAAELTSTIQETMADESSRKQKDKVRHKDREGDHGRREKRDEEKRHRDKDDDKERRRHRERRKDNDGEDDNRREHRRDEEKGTRHSDKEKGRDKDNQREREKDERRKDRDRHREKEKDRDRTKDRNGKEREKHERDGEKHRDDERHKDRDSHKDSGASRDKDRQRDRDKDRERRERRDKTKEGRDDSRERDKRRDERVREKERRSHKEGRDNSREREKRREERAKEKERRYHKEEGDEKRSFEKEGKERDSDRHRKHEEETDGDRERRRKREHEKGKDNNIQSERHGRHERETELKKDKRHEERRRRKEEEKKHKDDDAKVSLKRDEKHSSDRQQKKDKEKERERRNDENTEDIEERVVPEVEAIMESKGAQDDDEGYGDYEDDFEDYEDDDFESDDENNNEETNDNLNDLDLAELKQAIAAENEAMNRKDSSSRSASSSASTRPSTSSRRTFINFVAAKQRQISDKVSQKTRRRGEELMKLIELDTVAFDLFDMPPLKDYDRYIRHFGRSNTRQITTQTKDDNLERDTQTEDIEYREKWTQHPAEGMASSGVGDDEISIDDHAQHLHEMMHSLRLTQFLEEAGQLMITLLEERQAEVDGGSLRSNQRHIVFSDGYTQLTTDFSFLNGRPVMHLQVHPVQTHLLMTVHSSSDMVKDNTLLSRRGLICIWNINAPTRPTKVLSCQSQPCSCCWSPSKATLAFSGTEDGSILLWDLREPSNMHHQQLIGDESWVVRVPTYSTDGVQTDEVHQSRVVALQPIVSPEDSVRASVSHTEKQADLSSGTFQLASLEEKGVINFWVVLEVGKTPMSGSESELGLVPSGRLKLIRSSSVSLVSPSRELGISSSLRAHCFQLDPFDPNHIYVGTDAGIVMHTSRHQGKVCPKTFHGDFDVPMDIVSIDFSPFALSCFLVACGDGSIRLHKSSSEFPLAIWSNSTNGMGIAGVAWSRSKPSVFFVVDVTAKVYVWSLLERDGSPIKTEQFSNGRLTTLAISNDFSASSRGMPGRRPEMILTNEKGGIEVHRLNQHFSAASGDELDAMAALLDSLI